MKNLKEISDTNFRNKLKKIFPNAFEGELLDINNDIIINCKFLWFNNLNIKDLTGIEWFINLENLDCSYNRLTSLPNLPNALKELHCYNNKLTTLPNLPDTLEFLGCCDNKLISLPNLPDTLKSLYCFDNRLTTLPKLPKTLKYLWCSNNRLTSLPNLPDILIELSSHNNNNMLPPARLPKNLKYFKWLISYRNKNNQIEGELLKYTLIKK